MRTGAVLRPGRLLALLVGTGLLGFHYSPGLINIEREAFNTPVAKESEYELETVSEKNGKRTVARWNPCQKAITWMVNLDRVPSAQRDATLREISSGFEMLSQDDGMTYRYAGTTDFLPTNENVSTGPAEIVVAAAEATDTDLRYGEALGVGGTVWATWQGSHGDGAAIVRGYVLLSPTGMDGLKPGFGKGMTQGNLILHELGHATGLEHDGSHAEVMNATLNKKSPSGYARGDLAGLRKLGSHSGCLSIPAGVGLKDLN